MGNFVGHDLVGLGLLYVEHMFFDRTGEMGPRRAAAAREVVIRASSARGLGA
jgi:hypothetical protein